MSDALEDRYALASLAATFANEATESEFQRAELLRIQPRIRARLITSGVALSALTAFVAMQVTSPFVTMGIVTIWVLYVLVWYGTRPEVTSGAILHGAVSALFAIGGPILIWILAREVDAPHGAAAALVLLVYFQLASGAVRLRMLALAVAPELVLGGYLALTTGQSLADTALTLLVFGSTYLLGITIGIVQARESRRAYANEAVIRAQRATIERQRGLLEKELSHQVAERSRELGDVLAGADVTMDARRLTPGERFAGRYRVLRTLGAGGMGTVYEVARITDGAALALKAIAGAVPSAQAARFAREAEIGARVRHPNVVSIVDIGVSTGVPFLVMELVRGGSLEERRPSFGKVDWSLALLRQIADGLGALHAAGVVHRDLKPANILLDGDVAKLSDFGISRLGQPDSIEVDPGAATEQSPRRRPDLTGAGAMMGTPLYMPPECVFDARAADTAADVFSFAVLAYELLSGRPPFDQPPYLLALAHETLPRPFPLDDSEVPAELATLLARALSTAPAQRPKLAEIRRALTLAVSPS